MRGRSRLEPTQSRASGRSYAAETLGPLIGRRVAGGCYACTSFQEVEAAESGEFLLLTFHAPGCPFGGLVEPKTEDELVAEVAAFVHRVRLEGVARA